MNNCKSTYASLRIQKQGIDLASITDLLGLQPSSTTPNIWIYSTEGHVQSLDLDEHIFSITEPLIKKGRRFLRSLEDSGYKCDIFCYWLSENGHGGPVLKTDTIIELGCLGLELGFDFYSPNTK